MSEVKAKAKDEYVFQRITISAEQLKSFPPDVQERLIKKDQDILKQEEQQAVERNKAIGELNKIAVMAFYKFAKSFDTLIKLKTEFEKKLFDSTNDIENEIQYEINNTNEILSLIQQQGFDLPKGKLAAPLKEIITHYANSGELIKPYINPWYHNSNNENLIVKPEQAIEYCKQLAEGYNYRLYVEYLKTSKSKNEEDGKETAQTENVFQDNFILSALKDNCFVNEDNTYIEQGYGMSEKMDGFLLKLMQEGRIPPESKYPFLERIYKMIKRKPTKYNHNTGGFKTGTGIAEKYILDLNNTNE
jgi:hypothetical protein